MLPKISERNSSVLPQALVDEPLQVHGLQGRELFNEPPTAIPCIVPLSDERAHPRWSEGSIAGALSSGKGRV